MVGRTTGLMATTPRSLLVCCPDARQHTAALSLHGTLRGLLALVPCISQAIILHELGRGWASNERLRLMIDGLIYAPLGGSPPQSGRSSLHCTFAGGCHALAAASGIH